jgi:hypothetical protein
MKTRMAFGLGLMRMLTDQGELCNSIPPIFRYALGESKRQLNSLKRNS